MRIAHRPLTEYDKKFRIGHSNGSEYHKGEHGFPYWYVALKKKVYIFIK
jgi:hypothetical protein